MRHAGLLVRYTLYSISCSLYLIHYVFCLLSAQGPRSRAFYSMSYAHLPSPISNSSFFVSRVPCLLLNVQSLWSLLRDSSLMVSLATRRTRLPTAWCLLWRPRCQSTCRMAGQGKAGRACRRQVHQDRRWRRMQPYFLVQWRQGPIASSTEHSLACYIGVWRRRGVSMFIRI